MRVAGVAAAASGDMGGYLSTSPPRWDWVLGTLAPITLGGRGGQLRLTDSVTSREPDSGH